MDMPFPADLIKQQQDIQSNPMKAVEQMKEMGMILTKALILRISLVNWLKTWISITTILLT